jgi:PhnB protein
MPKKAKPIPDGYHTVTPYLVVKDGSKALEFYKKAFNAQEMERHDMPDGKVMHATFKIGDSIVMLSDEFPPPQGCGMMAPPAAKGLSMMLHLYVEDVDTSFNRALKAGAKTIRPVEDTFWGDRYGQLEDPFGHRWSISTHKEDLSPEEIEERAQQCCSKK